MNKSYYEERVNRVLDYITQHLDGDLSLSRLASVSNFSAFHFHRSFHGITGETLNSPRQVRAPGKSGPVDESRARQADH